MYVSEIKHCSVCNKDIKSVLSFPDLPLTGIFINKNEPDNYPRFDQELMICEDCGHIQLKNIVDTKYLYQDTYIHRSGQSQISTSGNNFFVNYLIKINNNKQIKSIFEIGCNDLYLLKKLEKISDELVGVDPIWNNDVSYHGKIKVLGGFVEDIDFSNTFDYPPEFIISSHTFEHIVDVHKVLESILSNVQDGTKFLIEVPSMDTLLKLCRFDQIFHQHFNYFSLYSFFNFIQLHNCEFIEHTMNYDYWGGTMLVLFEKGGNSNKINPFKQYTQDFILRRFEIFKNDLKSIELLVQDIDEDIYGFGAAQMLPMISYHMESKLSFLKIIIDDNKERCNKKLVGLDVEILSSDMVDNINESVVLITALDSAKQILNRLQKDFKPRYIIKPIQIF